jgi:cytochrome c553
MPNGMGRTETTNIVGLPRAYFEQTMKDFADGKRVTSDSRKTNTATMSSFAKGLTEAETKQVIDYFTAFKPRANWITVKESATVPKTRPQGGIFFLATGDAAGTEPLGNRIIEIPNDSDQTEKWRNPHSGFTAYVPVGSIAKGRTLATTGGGRFTACTTCHGADLKGAGPIPPLAGRNASYLARQLNDMQQGNRTGDWTILMAPVVSALTQDDIVNLVAYASSLPQ